VTDKAATAEKTWPIGKKYDAGFWQADVGEFQAYARATNDENPAYFSDNPVAPPMYHVKPMIPLMTAMAGDPELDLDFLRLVHGEHSMRFRKPVRHGDVIQLRGELADVQEKSSGLLVKYGVYGFVDGEVVFEGSTAYFIRAKTRSDTGKKAKSRPVPEPLPEPTYSVKQPVAEDQAIRYAAASGDENPLHTDIDTAKKAGLPNCILHGLCTMAFAQRDIINTACNGDPSRLAYIGVRWAKPVFPGQELTLKVWEQGEGKLAFLTENDAGQVVVTNGQAEIA
jgi:(3R)-3-hydroxyacyl-CoA dehydrogenase / 3a,7a,12a-trihydroxy-5b-cholest-24-enoyl-CoA hydratase / enoyl-CoA hydratase 2